MGSKMSNRFRRGWDWFVCGVTSEKEISAHYRRFSALIFTILAIILGCYRYTRGSLGEIWQIIIYPIPVGPSHLTFQQPGFIHALFGLLLCAPLYMRNFLPFNSRSPYYYLTLCLNIFFFATIAQLVTGAKLTFTYNLTNTIIIAALVLTWLGIRSVAGFAWIIVFGVVAYNLVNADAQMKDLGIWFLICAFFSLIFQSDLTPGDMFRTFKEEFRDLNKSQKIDVVKESVNDAIKTGGKLVINGAGIIK